MRCLACDNVVSEVAASARMATGEYFDCCAKCITIVKELNAHLYRPDVEEKVEAAEGQDDATTTTTHLHTDMEERGVDQEIANLLAGLDNLPEL